MVRDGEFEGDKMVIDVYTIKGKSWIGCDPYRTNEEGFLTFYDDKRLIQIPLHQIEMIVKREEG